MEPAGNQAQAAPRPKRAVAKNRGQTSPLPMRWRPALLPWIGRVLDGCWRLAARAIPGVLRRPLGRLARLAAGALYAVAPGHLLWPVLEPSRVAATLHVVRDEAGGQALDCWVWVHGGSWRLLWQNGSLGKGVLSRSDPTWAPRFRRDLQQQQQQRTGELFLEDITERRRAARQDSAPAACRPVESLGVADDEAERMEPVQLSPFEALFLSELGCIDVGLAGHGNGGGGRIAHAELYALLERCHPQRDFALKYAA
ncbi:tRNA splicing endonuclease subunit sen2, partial [Coemansia helicoidea]